MIVGKGFGQKEPQFVRMGLREIRIIPENHGINNVGTFLWVQFKNANRYYDALRFGDIVTYY